MTDSDDNIAVGDLFGTSLELNDPVKFKPHLLKHLDAHVCDIIITYCHEYHPPPVVL